MILASFMKLFLQKLLAVFARIAIKRYRPKIIAVTGSVGKTSTKDAIFAVLKKKYRVRQSEKSLNTEIGLPLVILDAKNNYNNFWGWLIELLKICKKVILGFEYPKILVLEYGIQKPGDMDYLLSIAKPDIAVVTAIGDVPVHVEFFKDPEELICEKTKLVRALPSDGHVILNHDDFAVYGMKDKTTASALTFGIEEHADVKIINYKLQITKDEELGDIPEGISFKIEYEGSVVPIRLNRAFGMPQAYAASAAVAVGVFMGMNLVEISEALRDYEPPPGRLRLLKGIKNSFILDDTYNASPESMRSALDTLKELTGRRKIAALGDMLEIGRYTEQAHRAIGDQAAKFVDLLFTAGPRGKFIADEALTRGVEPNASKLERQQVFSFDDSVSAGKALDPLIHEGDLILVKGSQGMRMEKVVEEIMASPEKAGEFLVRQDEFWKSKKVF